MRGRPRQAGAGTLRGTLRTAGGSPEGARPGPGDRYIFAASPGMFLRFPELTDDRHDRCVAP